jgi:Tfp pilus assembly protein PilF
MGENRHYIFSGVSLRVVFFFVCVTLCSCTIPQIVVLDDPLSASEHNDLGVVYENKGMYDLAEKEYVKALKKEDRWAVPYFNLGNLYYKEGHYTKAEHSYRKALDIDKDNPAVLNNLAYLLYEQGRYKEALILVDQALTIECRQEYLDTRNKILEKSHTQ